MIITPWKCNQTSYVSCLPVYNSYCRELTGKRTELSISNCTWYSIFNRDPRMIPLEINGKRSNLSHNVNESGAKKK